MTKKELQKQNEYLLLQLKVVNQLVREAFLYRDERRVECLGAADYCSSAEAIKRNWSFITEFNQPYNFYNKTMNIDDYRLN